MIRCRLAHLEARCRERGYTLEQVRPCIVSERGAVITVDETHPAYPHKKPGLGDMVAAGLSAVGITKERAQAVASAVGVKDCGCKRRQEALNAIGRKLGIG
jgi:hypothetical protein